MDWMEQLQIRYVKMHFTLQFIEDADLHTYKNSMFRGGIGEMLLQQHCIRDRICRDKTKTGLCEFEKECVVQQMMYTEPEILPDYMKERCSVGYTVECESKKRHFAAGDTLEFSLILFGKNIAYLSLYMQAVYLLGQNGLGKDRARYVITQVTNQWGKPVPIEKTGMRLSHFRSATVADYAKWRMSKLEGQETLYLHFVTPMTTKFRGEPIRDIHTDVLKESLLRRLYTLNCLEGRGEKPTAKTDAPRVTETHLKEEKQPRFSGRDQEKKFLKGLVGTIKLEDISEEWLALLCAGELVHIGKSVSMGAGRYRIRREGEE